jgi:Peptidase family C25
MNPDKVIITNLGALKEKYDERFGRIEQAVQRIIAADQKRGLDTKLVALDSEADMAAVHGEAVKEKEDQGAVKKAVDALFNAYEPDYMMILGAQDIVPHQDLKNPAYDPGGDDDKVVPSDIPYACEAAYSKEPGDFVGPTRVVGRVPDLVRSSDPAYLVSLLGTSARHKTRPRSEYQKYFSVSAEVWKASTALSLTKIFGSSASMATSPPKGPSWKNAELGRRVHFINCHGSPDDPNFYGQRGRSYPIAHTAKKLVNKIMNGTVIAVECCYGAQLYDPADADMQPGICSTYLRDGAYGFFGSSTIAYGPSEGNGQADLICQYFIEEVLDGASLGEATLKARHRFAQAYTHVDPTDLKTMIQFHLFGDPSVHPVGAVPHALVRTKTFKQAFRERQNAKGTRRLRRERAARTGTNLQNSLGRPDRSDEALPGEVEAVLQSVARESGLERFGAQSFAVKFPGEATVETMKRFAPAREGRALYMISGLRPLPKEAPGRVVVVVGTVQNGQLIHMRRLHSR